MSVTPAIPIPGFVRQPVPTENSYRLARDISGIGLNTADAIAMKLDVREDAAGRHLLRFGQAMDFEQPCEFAVTSKYNKVGKNPTDNQPTTNKSGKYFSSRRL